MVIEKLLVSVSLVLFSLTGTGQLERAGIPASSRSVLNEKVSFIDFEPQAFTLQEDSKQNALPLFAGYTIPVSKQPMARWEKTESGEIIARFGVTVNGVWALNLYFTDFYLEEGDQIFVYDPQKKLIIGSLTSSNNADYFAISFIPGDSLILEFSTKNERLGFPFLLSEIGVSVIPLDRYLRNFGDAGDCEILVNCPEGYDWQKEKNGVTKIQVKDGSSLYWCSGSLTNNTRQDGTPYLLTANHCGVNASAADYAQWIFYFKYESPDCEFPVDEPELHTMTGATKIANASGETSAGSDFKLLLLKEQVPQNYEPYFNGWDRSGLVSKSGVGIHHPEGDLKMISTYVDPVLSTQYLGEVHDPNGKYWKVVWSPTDGGHGVTEGGSSGSPLFSSEGKIIGALTGGRSSCNYLDEDDYYGKFSYSWNLNGSDSASQLSVWLDPDNTNLMSLGGTDLDSTNLEADFRAEFTNLLISESANFINSSAGDILSYNWYFPGGIPDFSDAKEPSYIKYIIPGDYDVKLVVHSASGADSLTRLDYIHVLPEITPNPSSGLVRINFGNQVPDDLKIEVSDINGREVQFKIASVNTANVTIDLNSLADNFYFIMIETEQGIQTFKVMLLR